MEENEMIEEMDVVANELLAVQGDVLTSNEAMKAEIIGSIGDLSKEVQDTAFDTQQAIDELKDMLNAPCKDRPAPPPMPGPAPDGGLEKAIASQTEIFAKRFTNSKLNIGMGVCTFTISGAPVMLKNIISNANMARKKSKQSGMPGVVFYDDQMGSEAQDVLNLVEGHPDP